MDGTITAFAASWRNCFPGAAPARPKPNLSLPEFPLSQAQRYYLTIANLATARGPDPDLSFQGSSPQSFADALQEALRKPILFDRWKARQPDPDNVDPSLAPDDPNATVTAELRDLHTDVEVVTTLTHAVLRHRLFILIGPHWQLHDVAAVR
jgi:hypothetical protein